jgi:tetratricopeptide (TPR) repeat protein
MMNPSFFRFLPEPLWAEVNRRLRAEPALWDLAQSDGVLPAFVAACKTLDSWRPGSLGLVALSTVFVPAADPVAWLAADGRDKLARAYDQWHEGRANGEADFPELIWAAIAAVALKQKLAATNDFAGVAATASGPDHWALPLVCLYGLLDDPGPLIEALLHHSAPGLVARMWIANESPKAVAGLASQAAAGEPASTKIALAESLQGNGFVEAARAIAAGVTASLPTSNVQSPISNFRSLDEALHSATLALLSSDDAAQLAGREALGRLVESAQAITASLAMRLGQLSMKAGDPVSALAAFQEARTLQPHDPSLRPFLAEAKLACGQDHEALVELHAIVGPANAPPNAALSAGAHLAAARVHRKAGNDEQALLEATAAVSFSPDVETLRGAVVIFVELNHPQMAAQALNELLVHAPADKSAHLMNARLSLAANQIEAALASAWQAVGLAPEDSVARQTLAEALGRSGDHALAFVQWGRAVELDPRPAVKVKLAEAALAADHPDRALATAQALLEDSAGAADVNRSGLTLIIAGRALATLNQPEKAFEHFNKATAVAPSSVIAWRAVAAYHRSRGDVQRALIALEAGRTAATEETAETAELYAELGDLHAKLHHPAEAIAAYERAAKIAPDIPNLHRRLGELYRAQKNYPAATDSLRRAAIATANDPGLWHMLGQTFEAAGQNNDALSAYQQARAVALGGGSTPLLRDLGRLAYQLGQTDLARSALETALGERESLDLNDLQSLTLLGAIYEAAQEYMLALAVYKRAILLAPDRSDLCIRLGVCCLELGQAEAAIAALKDAAERDLDDVTLQKLMGQAYATAHLWTESALAYRQAARLAPGDHQLLQTIGRVEKMAGDHEAATTVLRQAITLAPTVPDYQRDLAELLTAEGKLTEARALYLEATRLAPQDLSLLMALGQVNLMMNENDEAGSIFEKIASLDPKHVEALQALGEVNARTGKLELAHVAFSHAAELEPHNSVHWLRAGECLWQLGQTAAATSLWQRALLANPDDPVTHARLGAALNQQGRHVEAMAAFEKASLGRPNDPALAVDAARTAITLGEFQRALAHLERATKLAPNEAAVWQMVGEVCHAQGLRPKALTAFQRAAQLAPTDGKPQAAIAQLLAESGNLPEALVSAEAALHANPNDYNVLASVAEVFAIRGTGRLADAVTTCRRVADARPTDPGAQLALARALVLDAESKQERGVLDPTSLQELPPLIEDAAKLGADAAAVREWSGRAAAVRGEAASAIPLLESAAISRPSADLFRGLAACYRAVNKLTLARQSIQAALERAPSSIANLIELGQICLAQDDKAGAKQAFTRAIALDPRHARAHQQLAELLLTLGERAEGLAMYSQALTLDPARADWHHRLAELHESRRESESALAHYQRAAALAVEQKLPAGEAANYLVTLARAQARDGDFESARKQFEAALALRDDQAAWWAQCGEINLNLHNYERASDCFNRACALAPDDTASLIGAARAALALGHEEEAEAKAISVLRFNPDHHGALIAIGELFSRRGDFANAIIAYTRAIQHAPSPQATAPILSALAGLQRANKQPAEAVATLKCLLDLDPDDDKTLGALGDALAEMGQTDEAMKAFQQAARIAPRQASHLLRLGQLSARLGRLDAALGYLGQARELEPRNTDIIREIGQVFEDRRQFDRAYEVFNTLITLEPQNDANFFHVGIALKHLHDYVQSAEMFRRAVEINPANTEANRQRIAVAALGILKGKEPARQAVSIQ